MSKVFSVSRSLFIVLSVFCTLSVAMADDDHIEARRLLLSGEILPLEVILKKVRQELPGKVLDIDLEKEDHQIVYEIEILRENGVIEEVYINARTGERLSSMEDD